MSKKSAAYQLAKKYYPNLWGVDRINALVTAGKLTQAEADEIMQAEE